MTLTLALKTESVSNKREHWAARHKRTQAHRRAAMLHAKPAARALRPVVSVSLTRVAPRELDDDNLRGALKAIRDGVAAALRVDDATPLVEWRYFQRKGGVKEYAVEIELSVLSHVARPFEANAE